MEPKKKLFIVGYVISFLTFVLIPIMGLAAGLLITLTILKDKFNK